MRDFFPSMDDACEQPWVGLLILTLPGEAETLELGSNLGACLAGAMQAGEPFALLLEGPLGAGKTTLVRGLVAALPGGELAEVASPSFTLANVYPTVPELAHFDLYRMAEDGPVSLEELEEALAQGRQFVVVEWSERLDPAQLPAERLHVRLAPLGTGRLARLTAEGSAAGKCLALLGKACEVHASDW